MVFDIKIPISAFWPLGRPSDHRPPSLPLLPPLSLGAYYAHLSGRDCRAGKSSRGSRRSRGRAAQLISGPNAKHETEEGSEGRKGIGRRRLIYRCCWVGQFLLFSIKAGNTSLLRGKVRVHRPLRQGRRRDAWGDAKWNWKEGRKEGRRKELAVLTAVAVSYRVFKSDECYARAQRKRERERGSCPR